MSRDVEALEEAKRFLKDEVTPQAQNIDRDVEALRVVVRRMGELNLLALKRPEKFGGPEMPEFLFRVFQEEMARTSGALAFLTTQHQSAVSMIGSCPNESLKELYLPHMANGDKLVGIGFSQLRRGGPPIMKAEPVEGGFKLDGNVPWITGWSFFPEFLIGASLPNGEALFAVVPLTAQEGISISEPMRLAAMDTAMTVSANFEGFVIGEEKVAFIRPAGWIQNSDMINIALQGHFAIGCAMAGIDVLRANAAKKPFGFLCDAAEALDLELAALRMSTAQAQKSAEEETTPERLKVRAWSIDFAVRCAHAAITSSSGAANSLNHPAQRIYREALVYTVSAQTPPIMEATLDRLTKRGGI